MKPFFLLLLLPSVFVAAQHEKTIVYDPNAQVRSVSRFNKIDISGAIDLYIAQGTEEAVAVSAGSPDLLSRIKTTVFNDVLEIAFDSKGLSLGKWGNNKIKAYVTVRDLFQLESSGACNIKVTDSLESDALKIILSGASDFAGQGSFKLLKIDMNGASHLKISGNAKQAEIKCSGASEVKAFDLVTEECDATISGASSIRINVTKALNAAAVGASSILYKGNCTANKLSNSGVASIKHVSN